MSPAEVDLILPCLNEASALPWVLDRLPAGVRAVVVDNGSTDGSPEIAAGLGATVDAWETTYVHLLPASGDEHPVLRWMEGTALRPVKAVLDDAGFQAYKSALSARLEAAYPVVNGLVPFAFRRIFVVARTAV